MTPAKHSFILAPRVFVLSLFFLLLPSIHVRAASITVNRTQADITEDNQCSLAEALINANDNAQTHDDCTGGDGDDTINLTGNVTLPDANALAITSTLTINGGDYTLSGTGSLLHVSSPDTNTRTLTINNLTLTNNNNSTASGHALRVDTRALATINDSIFEKNTSTNSGAAISVGSNGRSLTINDSILRNNTSGGAGGAIRNFANSKMTINGSLFADNTASISGGAIYDDYLTEIYRSVFSGNSAGARGGAIFTERGLYIENSTLFNNSSGSDGGAVAGRPDTSASQLSGRIRHVTFVDNSATGAGNSVAIHVADRHSVSMYNSIIKRKSGATGNDCVGFESSLYNIIEDGSCADSSNLTVDPLLGTRSSGTLFYFPLRHNSLARDAANDDQCTILRDENGTDVDQRAAVRPYPVGGACDIGAYEWYPPPPDDNGGGGRDDDDDNGDPTPTPPPRPSCFYCPDLLARGFRLQATYGLGSGVEFRRVDRGGIGVTAALDAGFLDAVDVYGYAEQGVEVCFPGAGSLILLDATTSPRAPVSPHTYSHDGLTCAAIDRPGTLVLVSNPPAGLPVLPASVSFAAPAPAAESPASAYQQLQGCMVTTKGLIRFRDAPGGAPFQYTDPWGRQEYGWLPGYVTLTALARTPDWFKVDYYGARGWVSAHHVTPHGVCG